MIQWQYILYAQDDGGRLQQRDMPQNISYTNIASILHKEVNRVRNNPQFLIPLLHERIKKYDSKGNYFPLPGLNFSVTTKLDKFPVEPAGVRQSVVELRVAPGCGQALPLPELNGGEQQPEPGGQPGHRGAGERVYFLEGGADRADLLRVHRAAGVHLRAAAGGRAHAEGEQAGVLQPEFNVRGYRHQHAREVPVRDCADYGHAGRPAPALRHLPAPLAGTERAASHQGVAAAAGRFQQLRR